MTHEKADLVLHEGRLLGHPNSDAVALARGRILAHGAFADLKALVGPRTHLIRLGGRTVAPGFIDSHLHFLESAAVCTGTSVARCRTLANLLGELRVAAGKSPPGNWLRAFGCDESLLRERRGPTREELDGATARNPLRLRHQTLHASWLNSRAIAALGLEAPAFAPPAGAVLERDANGRLAGLVVGMEEWLTRRLPRVTAAELEARARIFSRELASAGVTAFTDATARNGVDEFAHFARFIDSGVVTQRVSLMIGADHLDALEEARSLAERAAIGLAGVKFMPASDSGRSEMHHRVAAALGAGVGCAFHATEVEELDEALAAIEAAPPPVGIRLASVCRIEHGGIIPPDFISRIAEVGAWVVTNPGFIHYRGLKYAADPGLTEHLYRSRSLLAGGIRMAAGTDSPVTPARPLCAIAAAISRATAEGQILAAQEQLAAGDALALFTVGGARLSGLEAGEIAPGTLADLVVLPGDPLALAAHELLSLPVDITIIRGRVVYERGRPAIASSSTADLMSG